MVDAFLIITSIVICIVLLIGIGMAIVYWQHPDDKNVAWIPKIIVLFGLFLSCCNVLILPLDIIDAQSGGGLNMSLVWNISFYLTSIFILIIIPFAYFYYENETDSTKSTAGCFGLIPFWNSQLCEGIKWSLAFFISFTLILVIMYLVIPFAYIPVTIRIYEWESNLKTSSALNNIYSGGDVNYQCSTNRITFRNDGDCYKYATTIEVQVTFPVYAMALLAFLGWFLFVVFAGMGLPALPWDLFNEWRFRPKPIDLTKYAEEKKKNW